MPERERIYIIFNWSGMAFALIILLVFTAGLMTGSVMQTLGVALVVQALVGLIQSNENIRGLEIIGCRSQPAPAGEMITLEVIVRNVATRRRVGVTIRTGWRVHPRVSAWLPVLEAGETRSLQIQMPALARGRYEVPTLWITSIRPVGICFAWKIFHQTSVFYVYPKPVGRPLIELAAAGEGNGEEGQHNDVSGHRPYTPGDLLSRMDWRVFARTGELLVRTLEQGNVDLVHLKWADTQFLSDPERRLEQLSYWIDRCVEAGIPFTLELENSSSRLESGRLDACREALAIFQPET